MTQALDREAVALDRFRASAEKAIAERRFSVASRAPKERIIRKAMPVIRALVDDGASLTAIRDMLSENGVVDVSLKTLRKVIRTIESEGRQRRNEQRPPPLRKR